MEEVRVEGAEARRISAVQKVRSGRERLRHEGAGFFATADFGKYLLGALIAGIVGYMTIDFLIRMVSTRRVRWFAIYCFVFGLILIVFFPR